MQKEHCSGCQKPTIFRRVIPNGDNPEHVKLDPWCMACDNKEMENIDIPE